jgi:succinyl-diaminopimelate desuccinylase
VLPVEKVAAVERELRAWLSAAARAIPRCRITVEKVSHNHPCFTPPDDPFFAAMADCVTAVRRRRSVFRTSYGFNDMHFFSHHLKIPTLGYGPGGENCHAVDERASVKGLVASAKIYARLLTTFAG